MVLILLLNHITQGVWSSGAKIYACLLKGRQLKSQLNKLVTLDLPNICDDFVLSYRIHIILYADTTSIRINEARSFCKTVT